MELTTIAKPYANAVFKIAEQSNTLAQWRVVLEVGASIANDVTMSLFVASPNITKNDKLKALNAVFASVLDRKLNKQESVFVSLLLDNGRINALPSILGLFDEMSNLSSDAKTFHVISAYELSETEKKNIVESLSDKFKTTVSIDTKIDTNLVGGVVVKEGDKVIDLSIKARVDALGSQLSVAY